MAQGDNIAHYVDVPLELEVELDRKSMTIRQVLELGVGSVIPMTRSAGENIDILINGKLVAFGEVLEMEGNAGIRLTNLKI